jgi:hypothetical protein
MRLVIVFLIFFAGLTPVTMSQDTIRKHDSIAFVLKTLQKVNKNVSFAIAPGPVFGVSQKLGFAVVPMLVYSLKKSDTLSPPSSSAVMIYFDFYGSWVAGVKQSLYWNQNKWRAFVSFGLGELQMKYYGIGRDTVIINDNDTNYVWAQQKELEVSVTCFRKIFKGLYGGLECSYTVANLQGTDSLSKAELNQSGLPLGKITQTEIIPTLVWDNRDNIFWSAKGYYASLNYQFSNRVLLNSPDYSILSGWVNGYYSLLRQNKRLTLAWHLFAQAGWGNFTYRSYAMYCRGDEATGYTGGKYVNYGEATVQTEIRYDLWRYIAFGYYVGTGKIFPSYSVFGQSAWLNFTGLRLYINIIPYRNIRLRLEVAKGRKDYGFYVGIGQGF